MPDHAAQTPISDIVARFIEEVRDGWRVKTDRPDGLASAVYGGTDFNAALLAALSQAEQAGGAGQEGVARLYDADEPMADGEVRMTAAENVLGWLLIEKIGVPDDRNYTPNEAQDILARRLESASDLENERSALSPAPAGVQGREALKPFADAADHYSGEQDDDEYVDNDCVITIGQLREARAAYAAPAGVQVKALREALSDMLERDRRRYEETEAAQKFFEEANSKAIAALSSAPPAAGAQEVPVAWQPTHVHVKRGSAYRVIDDNARLQAGGRLDDNEVMVIYEGEDGSRWVRANYEFFDGRFEPVAAPASPVGEER